MNVLAAAPGPMSRILCSLRYGSNFLGGLGLLHFFKLNIRTPSPSPHTGELILSVRRWPGLLQVLLQLFRVAIVLPQGAVKRPL